MVYLHTWYGHNWLSIWKKTKLDLCFMPCIKISSRGSKHLNVKKKNAGRKFRQIKVKMYLTKNIWIICFRKKSNSRLLVNFFYSVPNHYFDGLCYFWCHLQKRIPRECFQETLFMLKEILQFILIWSHVPFFSGSPWTAKENCSKI